MLECTCQPKNEPMKTTVTHPSGKVHPVKNLGWLLRHAGEVIQLELSPRNDGARCGCMFSAILRGGVIYSTAFNSTDLCRRWVKRPSLRRALLVDNA